MANGRSTLPSLLLAVAAAFLLSAVVSPRSSSNGFLHAGSAAPAARAGRVARHAFVDEFQEWRKSLTDDEQAMLGRQSKYMFNKTYRGSDEFDADIADEKIEKIGTILSKYFENEAAEYKKERLAKKQDPNALFEKSGGKTMDMTLSNNIVEVDRRADRRYYWAMLRLWDAKRKGTYMAPSSPYPAEVDVPSGISAADVPKEMLDGLSAEMKKAVEAEMSNSPTSGKMAVPEVVVKQMEMAEEMVEEMAKENPSIADEKDDILADVRKEVAMDWAKAFDRVDQDATIQKDFYSGMKESKGQTKADVIKAMWPELSKISKKPLPPLSEELLEDLAQEAAYDEHSFKNKFGVADKLYKSEAVDPFGTKFLLGVFETEDEAKKAFDSWNKAYEDSREKQLEKMAQWAKRQQAKLDSTADAQDRVFQAAMAS